MKEIIGLIRHILTFSGGYFVASGDLSEPALSELVASLMTIIGVAWSVIEKRKAAGKAIIPPAVGPLLLIPVLIAGLHFAPSGCVRGPDGQAQLDPDVGDFLKKAAQTAALVGVSYATGGVSELTPFAPQIISGVNKVFEDKDTPEDIGQGLQDLFKGIALEIGNEEFEKILAEYVAEELTPSTPGSDVGGAGQYKYNRGIVDAL